MNTFLSFLFHLFIYTFYPVKVFSRPFAGHSCAQNDNTWFKCRFASDTCSFDHTILEVISLYSDIQPNTKLPIDRKRIGAEIQSFCKTCVEASLIFWC